MPEKVKRGTVKWFNNQKGFGFITPEDNGQDVFCHHSEIAMEGFRTLSTGQDVEFDLVEGPKGPHAKSIRKSG